MNELPVELVSNVAGCLPPSDAIQLNNCCKALHSKVSLTATAPRPILIRFFRRDQDSDPHYGFHIPVPHQARCHSMLLSLMWKDQGWGNRKGKVFVLAEEKDRLYDRSSQGFGSRRVVFDSPIALHEEQRLNITFQPKINETYHLWYIVGGGGGHSLSLYSVSIRAVVFDDPSRCFGNAHSFLTRSEALAAWDKKTRLIVHLDIEKFIFMQGEHFMPPLLTFGDGHGASEVALQQKLMGCVQSLWESWVEEYFAYSKLMEEVAAHPSARREELRYLLRIQNNSLEDDFGEQALAAYL